MSIISLTNINKFYDKTHAVKNMNIDIQKQEIVAVLGSNGAGKSTTIKMICGLLKPSSGKLVLFDKSFEHDAQYIRRHIGYMPEESATYLDVSVTEYLLFFSRLLGIKDIIAKKTITKYANLLDIHADKKQLGELSKGMRRKVLIIRSLLNDPDLLIYDEPASGLDPQSAQVILDTMIKLKKEGKTIIFSSHHLDHVKKISDRIIIIKDGEKVADAPINEIMTKHEKKYIITTAKGKKTVSLKELQKMKGNEVKLEKYKKVKNN
jgi:ABC-2 type transport system ATP-binding protein